MLTVQRVETNFQGRWYDAEIEVEEHFESDWGADADGNRGTGRTICDDARILWVQDEDGNMVQNPSNELEDALFGELD